MPLLSFLINVRAENTILVVDVAYTGIGKHQPITAHQSTHRYTLHPIKTPTVQPVWMTRFFYAARLVQLVCAPTYACRPHSIIVLKISLEVRIGLFIRFSKFSELAKK